MSFPDNPELRSKHESHWSYDDVLAKLPKQAKRVRAGKRRTKTPLTNRERAIRALVRDYDCSRPQAERLLAMMTGQ